MKKGISLTISILIILFLAFSNALASEVSKIQRHVAMVYDDSTSMYVRDSNKSPVLNWAYANYMTQAFLALLNPQDSFYVTYMSDTENENVVYDNLLSADRSQAIEDIRNKNDYINKTPFEAVETAYNMLKDLDEDLTDEYWLVIVTDGEFTDYNEDVTQTLLGYIDEMAALDKTLKVVFLAIGDNTYPPIADETRGLIVYQTGTMEIVSAMASLADNISGRHNVLTSRMSELSGNRLSADMDLPVRSLIVFNQADGNKIIDISNSKEDEMILSSSYDIKAPAGFDFSDKIKTITDENALGTITRVEPLTADSILSEGRYILTFENAVAMNNIRVMYEPAIDIKIRYKQNGRIVENPEDGSLCDIEVVLINALTGNPLNSKVLPAEVECNIQIVSDGKVVKSAEGFSIQEAELKSGDFSINTEISMPGYFTMRNRQDYFYDETEIAAAATVPPEYDETKGPWPPEVTLVVQIPEVQNLDLKTLEEYSPFLVIPLFNEEKGQISDLQLGSFKIFSSRKIEFEISIDENNMGFLIAPKYYGDMYSTSTGVIDINVYFQSEYEKVAETSIILNINDLPWLSRNYRIIVIPALALIIVILILGLMVFRKKFAKGAWLEFTQMQKSKNGEWVPSKSASSASLNNLKGKWRMIPFAPERINISNVLFYPSADDQAIIIPKKSLKQNMGTSKGKLEPKDLKLDYYLQTGHGFYIETGKRRLVFVYHGPKKTLLTRKKR